MKKLMYFFGICIVLGFALSFVFSSLPVFSLAAKGFLMSVEQGNYQQAYEILSDRLKQRQSMEQFIADLKKSGLTQYESVQWEAEQKSPDGKKGTIIGVVTTKNNRLIPIQFNFILVESEDFTQEGWRIDSIHPPANQGVGR